MNYIVLDLEFNQAFPFKNGQKAEPAPECPFEIIQIGAVKLNENFEQTGTFDIMISPKLYPRLHPFVEKITGITPESLKNQPLFPEAYQAFLAFIGKEPSILCSWGEDDIKSLFRNICYYDLDVDALTESYLNVQFYASAYLNLEAGRAIGLKNAVTELGLPAPSAFHNALNDAIYTAEIFRIVRPEQIQPKTFQPLTMLAKKPRQARTDTRALLACMEEKTGRELTEDEKKLIKTAYALGRNHAFDSAFKKGKKQKPDTEKPGF